MAVAARLALGTVQFGLPYGVANATGQIGFSEVKNILTSASSAGLNMLDTAIAYGSSESVLGQAGVEGWQVVTKLPACPPDCSDVAAWVRNQVAASRARLCFQAERLYGVLLHRPAQLLEPEGAALYAALQALKGDGIAQRVGVSVYAPADLDALQGQFELDLVQLPMNILDARWTRSGWLAKLHAQGTEIHTRSVFLQGLLLMPPAQRPAYFSRWRALWSVWDAWLQDSHQSALQACLRHALLQPLVSRVVVGIDSLAQLQQILAAAPGDVPAVPPELATNDADLLNPALWTLN
ncbi:MAG: aldo/keto reductase [Burkholderiaceae bacterium]